MLVEGCPDVLLDVLIIMNPENMIITPIQILNWKFIKLHFFLMPYLFHLSALSSYDEQPMNQKLFVGQTARFECLIQGSQPADISWMKDGQPLVLDKSRMLILPSGSLEIYPVEKSDAGSYKCNTSNVDRYKLSYTGELTINNNYGLYLLPEHWSIKLHYLDFPICLPF